jgi:hypothetical protein
MRLMTDLSLEGWPSRQQRLELGVSVTLSLYTSQFTMVATLRWKQWTALLVAALALLALVAADDSEKRHTNNWAVLVCSSRYWFNYRVSRLEGRA